MKLVLRSNGSHSLWQSAQTPTTLGNDNKTSLFSESTFISVIVIVDDIKPS